MQNKPNLPAPQMNASSFITKDYENKRLADVAKTNPIKPNFIRHSLGEGGTKPIQTQFAEKPKMNENLFATKVYENETTFALRQNKPNTNPICRMLK